MGRKLTIRDAMIFVAATAVGLAWTKVTVDEIRSFAPPGLGSPRPLVYFLLWWPPAAVPVLMSASLAIAGVLAIGRDRHAPTGRVGPGAMACGVAALAMALQVGLLLVGLALRPIPQVVPRTVLANSNWPWMGAARGLTDVGLGVLAAWWFTRGTRDGQHGPRAFDIAGRFLGVGWIALFCIQRVGVYLANL